MDVLGIFWMLLCAAPVAGLLVARRAPLAATRVLAVWVAALVLSVVLVSWFSAMSYYGQTTTVGKLFMAAIIGAMLFPTVALWNGLRRALLVPLIVGLILFGLNIDGQTLAAHAGWIGGLVGAVASGFLLFDRRLPQGDAWFALGPPVLAAVLVVAWSNLRGTGSTTAPREAPASNGVLDRDWAEGLQPNRQPPVFVPDLLEPRPDSEPPPDTPR